MKVRVRGYQEVGAAEPLEVDLDPSTDDKRRRVLAFCSDPEGNCVFS